MNADECRIDQWRHGGTWCARGFASQRSGAGVDSGFHREQCVGMSGVAQRAWELSRALGVRSTCAAR